MLKILGNNKVSAQGSLNIKIMVKLIKLIN